MEVAEASMCSTAIWSSDMCSVTVRKPSICNPGLASIRAALEPADTNYYFYALGKDGVHHFFKTYREHVNFVNSSQYGG